VRRFFLRRKDLRVDFAAEIAYDADLNVIPAWMIKTITNENQMRLPVLVYGSHIYLRPAFIAGCSDFCKDPWSLEELEVRIDRLVSGIAKNYRFSWGEISFSGNDVLVNGSKVFLTYQEMRIFRLLVEQRGNPVPREVLFYAIWGNEGTGSSRVVDVHVASLRKKLGASIPSDSELKLITSVRKVGYIID
jgi:DNA-binding response OmpR family regulator